MSDEMPDRNTGEHLASLETRVGALENGVSQIITTLNALASKMEDRSRPQWQAIGVGVALLGLLGGFAYWPIRESLNDIKVSLHDKTIELQGKIEYLDRTTVDKETSTVWVKLRDGQIADIQRRLDRLEASDHAAPR